VVIVEVGLTADVDHALQHPVGVGLGVAMLVLQSRVPVSVEAH